LASRRSQAACSEVGKAPDTRAFAKDYANFYGTENLSKPAYDKARSVKHSGSEKNGSSHHGTPSKISATLTEDPCF
jgi:hypothetical protein